MNYSFLFPGQGSQSVGMGKDFFDAFDRARARFAQADELLRRDFSKIVFSGPAEELVQTKNTQPALYTVEAIIADSLAEKGIQPSYTAGHSIGEYGALYAAGVFSFEDGLRLVVARGELMADCGARTAGAMAAVIGMEKSRIAEVLAGVTSGTVVTANENSPDQTVISGEAAAVGEAGEKLKLAGAKKVIPLQVSGAFHSPLMQQAADAFSSILAPIPFSSPKCPVISNVTAKPERDGAYLKELLTRQLVSPVRWADSMAALAALGPGTCIEAGPGSVLRGLARKCSPQLNVLAADTVSNISFLPENKSL